MTTASDWRARVGDVWAAEWQRTDRALASLSRQLDAAILAAISSDTASVLDIGCGAGATSLALANARPDLAITGVDLSARLIEIAQMRVPAARFEVADVAHDPLDRTSDLLVSRHGVMFFADPVAAFTRLRRLARPGVPLIFSCFAARDDNIWASDLVETVTGTRPADAGTSPGPFAFADPNRVEDILTRAGWVQARPERADFTYLVGEGADPIADAVSFMTCIGPLASIINAAPDADRQRLHDRLAEALGTYRTDNRVQLPASAWIWRAQAGDPA